MNLKNKLLQRVSRVEVIILAVITSILVFAAAYNVYKNNLIALNAEATVITSKILKAQGTHFDKTGSFINLNTADGLKVNLTNNKFFDGISSSLNGSIFEMTLRVNRGFFKGTTAVARYDYHKETFFELSPKTKLPFKHL